ncbi:MAG: hypothetical protein R3A49_12210 [Acidimicrobiia bacterium]
MTPRSDDPAEGTRDTVALLRTTAERSQALLESFVDGLTARQVFGEPEHVGDHVVITAAAIQRSGGYGFGAGGGDDSGDDDRGESGGDGGGGGGGGHGEARPVAVIDVGPNGVRVQPVLDFTKIGVTVLAGVFAVWRAGRRRS